MLSFFDIRGKEVINIKEGIRIGYVHDILIDSKRGSIDSIIVYKEIRRFYGFWKQNKELIIPFEKVKKLEGDVILTSFNDENIKMLTDIFTG